MKRMICVTVGLVLLLAACLTAAAMGTNSAVQLVRVGSGAALTAASAVTMKNAALGEGSRGGAVYVENGGHAALEGAAFANNRAADGDNVYAEKQADVTGYNAEDPATAAPDTGKADKSDCGSVLGASAALIVTAAAVTLVKRKHK